MKTKHWAFLITGILIFSHAMMTLGSFLALRAEIPAIIEPIVMRRFAEPYLTCQGDLASSEARVENLEITSRWLAEEVADMRTALNHDFSLLGDRDRIDRGIQRATSKPASPTPAPKEKKTIAKK